jgi:hypothetical protein
MYKILIKTAFVFGTLGAFLLLGMNSISLEGLTESNVMLLMFSLVILVTSSALAQLLTKQIQNFEYLLMNYSKLFPEDIVRKKFEQE